MPTVFSAAQLAASATAGDPRTQDSFATTAEWHAYQAEWFKTVTMGEDLPPVGDPNRAKRWKSTRQQRGKIELQRERQQQPRTPNYEISNYVNLFHRLQDTIVTRSI